MTRKTEEHWQLLKDIEIRAQFWQRDWKGISFFPIELSHVLRIKYNLPVLGHTNFKNVDYIEYEVKKRY